MFSAKQRRLVFLGLAFLVQAQENTTQNEVSNSSQIIYIVMIGLVAALGFFILYDRRQDYAYLQIARNTLGGILNTLIAKFKPAKRSKQNSEKLGMDEQVSTQKATVGFIQSQKTFIQADIASIQQTTNTIASVSDQLKQMNLQDQTPQVNLKQVFDKKSKKNKSNKSKSKLKNKVQIKKSEADSERVEHQSDGVEDLENSLEYNEA